jgi:hypothetical protein
MLDFAIIAEGPTDQIVLRSIIDGVCDWEEDPFVTNVQPPYDETSKERVDGGWTLVLDQLTSGKYKDALATSRYVIVQIDTDILSDLWTSLQRPDPLPATNAVQDVIAALAAKIDPSVRDRLIFAIGVESTECWLLPLIVDRSRPRDRAKTRTCYKTVNHELKLQKEPPLGPPPDGKDTKRYSKIARAYETAGVAESHAAHNPGLRAFVDQLKAVSPPAP